jgi:hypothetical protein
MLEIYLWVACTRSYVTNVFVRILVFPPFLFTGWAGIYVLLILMGLLGVGIFFLFGSFLVENRFRCIQARLFLSNVIAYGHLKCGIP